MRVSQLDINDDWTFGEGRANYLTDAAAIRQNVKTRIRSFKNDWFLDMSANIDWIALLGIKNNKLKILREIERVILETDGVTIITHLEIVSIEQREVKLKAIFSTIYDHDIESLETIQL